MAEYTYTRSLINDFNNDLNSIILIDEITDYAGFDPNVIRVDRLGDEIYIVFDVELTFAEELILDNIIANHGFETLIATTTVDVIGPRPTMGQVLVALDGSNSSWQFADHDLLLNFVPSEHIDHSSVSISAGTGLSGGGDLTTTRTLSLDIPGLTALTTPDYAADYISIYDASATTHKKLLLGSIDISELSGYESSEHIDHASISIFTGSGLTGGGDLTTSRTINLDYPSLIQDSSPSAVDYIATYEVSTSKHKKIQICDIDHDVLANFVANEHINHSSVSILSGIGLTGGGDLTATRTLAINIPGLTQDSSPNAADYLVTYDASASTHKKIQICDIDHDVLANFVANEHVNHASVSITAGTGLTGGGDLTTTRTLSLNVNGLTADASPDYSADYIPTYDASASTHKKLLLGNIALSSLSGYVANQHIDHSTVSVTAGTGLTGGGNITATRTIALDINGLTTDASPDTASDFIPTFDASTTSQKKILMSSINHNALTNYVANQHIDHSTVSVFTGSGLTGGGTIAASRTIDMNYPTLVTDSSPDTTADFISTYDTSASKHRKILLSSINHNALTNYVANQHIDHSTVSVTAGTGLTGGGNISATRTIALDINGLTTDSLPDTASDFIPTFDASTSTQKKILMSSINHNALTNYVANQHIDHTTVSIFTGSGLTGGGTIAASRTIDMNYPTLIQDSAPSATDYIATYDVSASKHKKIQICDIDHDVLANFVANEHINHSSVSITAGTGLTGGGDLTATRTLAINVNGLTTDASPDTTADFIPTYDASAATHKKVLLSSINHDALTNFVANEHIDHSSVSITAGTGLTGGGTIASTRTLSMDINGLTVDASPDTSADYIASYDVSAATHKKILLSTLLSSPCGGVIKDIKYASSVATITTTTATYATVNGMSLTTSNSESLSYFIFFNSTFQISSASRQIDIAIYVNGVILPESRRLTTIASANSPIPISTMGYQSSIGNNVSITVEWKRGSSSATASMFERNMFIVGVKM
jgi:hypothetical protein